MDNYKVVYQARGCDWLYGYAGSVGEAIELRDRCADEGWQRIKIKVWKHHQWMNVNIIGGNINGNY